MNNIKEIEKFLLNLSISEWEELKKDVDIKIKNISILKPIQVILEKDCVFVFYKEIKNVINQMNELYEQNKESDISILPFNLWCDNPRNIKYKFMGIEYEAICLWYDYQNDIAEGVYNYLNNLITN